MARQTVRVGSHTFESNYFKFLMNQTAEKMDSSAPRCPSIKPKKTSHEWGGGVPLHFFLQFHVQIFPWQLPAYKDLQKFAHVFYFTFFFKVDLCSWSKVEQSNISSGAYCWVGHFQSREPKLAE